MVFAIRDSWSGQRRTMPGVTLIELMIVVGIIGILASLMVGAATFIQDQGNEQVTRNVLGLLESSLEQYYEHEGAYPAAADPDPNVNSERLYFELNRIQSSREILVKISSSLIQNKAATEELEIYDRWGTVLDYIYRPGVDTFPRLISAGPDGRFDKQEDNITSVGM
ncbi:MAG: type II secretion system protein [Planctomycetota bacterium]